MQTASPTLKTTVDTFGGPILQLLMSTLYDDICEEVKFWWTLRPRYIGTNSTNVYYLKTSVHKHLMLLNKKAREIYVFDANARQDQVINKEGLLHIYIYTFEKDGNVTFSRLPVTR